ncbi:MAG: ATP-binding protein [Anaerolineae bacterium]|nr:ATP-binding protein [Anaerolineae bacterium]
MRELPTTEVPAARRTREDLQLLAVREILRATAAALPLEKILSVTVNMAIIVFDATTSWLMLAEDTRLRTAVARGEYAERLVGATCEGPATACCRVVAAARPEILQPQDVDPADPVIGFFARNDEPVVLVPIESAGRVVGLLGSAVRPEAAVDISFLVTMAEQAGSAIESARLREEMRTWRERLDAVFERMAEAVLVFDREGRLVLMNAAAEELLAERGVRVGDRIPDIVAKATLMVPRGRPEPPEETSAARALRGERVENLEIDLPRPTGPTRHLLISGVPLVAADGSIEGAVVVWRDITYIKELERMRAEFLSMVSHELRSPLTSILGYAQLIQRQIARGRPLTGLESRLQVIVDQAKRVNSLVEDLLEASRAEAGRLGLRIEEVDLAEIVRKSVEDSTRLSPAHRFRIELPPEVPRIRADPNRIEQVLKNLLSNAVKFSLPGTEVTVRLRVEPARQVISVTDQGVGIRREDLDAIFVPFHRVRQVGGREVKGIGLGLFISRSIVEAHGGDMWVESELGKGSTFYFSLPRQ